MCHLLHYQEGKPDVRFLQMVGQGSACPSAQQGALASHLGGGGKLKSVCL